MSKRPDQAEALRTLVGGGDPARSRVIAVTSGKGGVGKTNLAVNLGIALAQRGLKTGILDADLGLANVDIVLGMSPPLNLGHVLDGEKSLAEVMVVGPEGLRLIAGGSGVYELANLSQWRLERFIRTMQELDMSLDVLFVDTGAGISHNVLAFLLAACELLVVTTTEPTAIADAYGVIKVTSAKNPSARIHLVVNMAPGEDEAEAASRSLASVVRRFLTLEIDYLGYVPRDIAVNRAVQDQIPFVLAYPGSRAAQNVQRIASRLSRVEEAVPRGGLAALFSRMAKGRRG